MAVGTVDAVVRPDNHSDLTFPVGTQSDWVVACTAPQVIETDTGVIAGGKVVKPGAITRTTQNLINVNNKGTTLLVALQYNADVGTPTSPVIRVFGRDKAGLWHLLKDTSTPPVTEVTLTLATATDVVSADGLSKISLPVEFDLQGSFAVIVAIQGSFAVTTGTATDAKVLVKLKSNR
jgi:hypothetical protein